MRRRVVWLLAAAVLTLGGVSLLAIGSVRSALVNLLPPRQAIALWAWYRGVTVDHDVIVKMPDGTPLATSVFLPRRYEGKLPTVLVRMPYHRLHYGEGWWNAMYFAQNGYAAVVQDLRGTGDSGGELLPWRDAGEDGVATLDWISAQPWSNAKVGTFGCSALGETQFALARTNHPAHRAMIPSGAGGGVGSAAGRYSYFGVFEGGIFQLASGFGWFVGSGSKDPKAPPAQSFSHSQHLRGLPVNALVERVRPSPNGYTEFLNTPLGDPLWADWGYWTDSDRARVPAMVINTWGDQTLGDTLALAESWRASGVAQKVIIAPGDHCGHARSAAATTFGVLPIERAAQPWHDWYVRWFDHWLKGHADALAELKTYNYFMLVENRWLAADTWPPAEAKSTRWFLGSDGRANTRSGNGRLLPQPAPTGAPADEFRYDPNDPVPTRGGPVCCTGNPADKPGPADQTDVEVRDDVLVYTSDALTDDLRIAGPLKGHIAVSSSALDTDLVLRLVHVWPDGRATNIQEGALRLRYRDGFTAPKLLTPGERVEVVVDMRSIAYMVPKGHRLRLHITSSSFPRLERNLNTGAANNAAETRMVVAVNRIHHSVEAPSWIEIPVLPNAP